MKKCILVLIVLLTIVCMPLVSDADTLSECRQMVNELISDGHVKIRIIGDTADIFIEPLIWNKLPYKGKGGLILTVVMVRNLDRVYVHPLGSTKLYAAYDIVKGFRMY